jgi:hypothetical protein
MRVRAGDTLLVRERRAGEGDREAVVIEVWGECGRPPYVVRWHDGRQNVFFPASADTLIPRSPPLALPAAAPTTASAEPVRGEPGGATGTTPVRWALAVLGQPARCHR